MPPSTALRHPVLAAAVVLAVLAAGVVPALAEPSSSEVRSDLEAAEQRYEEIDRERGLAQNAYNDALEELEFAEASLAALGEDLEQLSAQAKALRTSVTDHVRLLHRMGPSLELSMLAATQPAELGLRSTTLRQVLDRQRVDLEALGAANVAIATAEARQEELVAEQTAWTRTLDERNAELAELVSETAAEVSELEELLDLTIEQEELEAARQRALEQQAEAQRTAAGGAATSGPAPATRSSVGGAVGVALSQIGKPYAWGATGPGAFDCSGLVTYAYRAVGITHLPRSSAAMYGATTRISRADLRPGDLVFYYSPVSHVAIYIGNNQVVEAPNSGATVRVRTLQGPITGFGRV
ncbi:MAG: NlpC/P60 family protein [Nitriliruptoraceae bacterium]